jgi:hypothetical protein
MASGIERHEEVLARIYVREVADVEVILHDTAGRTGVHDYDLIREGKAEALEVSIWADKAQMEAEVLQRELYGSDLNFPNLHWRWRVQVLPRARLKQLSGRLLPHLQALENDGVQVLDIEDTSLPIEPNIESVAISLRRLGVTHVRSSARDGDVGSIEIIPGAGRDVSFVADDALLLIESHVTSSYTADILKKLLLGERARRHVFLWADRAGCPTPYWNLGNLFQKLPTREPRFSSVITDLWCVGASGGWLWEKGIGWRTVPAPHIALSAISEEESSLLRSLHAKKW